MKVAAATSRRVPLLGWLAVLVLLLELPVLLSPEIPPLDLANHLGRAHILAHFSSSPGLRDLYGLSLQPTPNLAADLLLTPMVAALGGRAAVRLFIGLSLAGMAAGLLLVYRASRGKLDAGALLLVPLAHNLQLNYGFINYYWGILAALYSYAAWLWLRRRRAGLWVLPLLSLWTYLMHLVGFGALMVAASASALAAVFIERRDGRWDLREALRQGLLLSLMAAVPAALYLHFSSGAVGGGELHRLISWTPPREKLLGLLRVLRATRPAYDAPFFGLLVIAGVAGARGLRRGTSPGRKLVLAAGLALLSLSLVMPGALDLETADIDLRVALPALLLVLAGLLELPSSGRLRGAALLALALSAAARGAGATAQWRRASEGIAESRRLCGLLPAGARVLTLHNEVPPEGEVEYGAGERHGWAYCLLEKPLFFPTLFHVPGSQPLRLRRPAYEATDTVTHYHLKNGFSGPGQAAGIPWETLSPLADYLWLTNWDLAGANPGQRVPNACFEQLGSTPRIQVFRLLHGRERTGCPG